MGDLSFKRVADVGCGSARRLIHLVETFDGSSGVGVDVSESVCRLAGANVARAGLADRITIVHGDLVNVVAQPEQYPDVVDADLVTTYFMLHHLVDTQVGGLPFLTALRAAFARADHLLVADGFRDTYSDTGRPCPLFTLAYELFHDFIGVDLHSNASGRAMFAANGYDIVREEPFGHPLEWLFVLRPIGRLTGRAGEGSTAPTSRR